MLKDFQIENGVLVKYNGTDKEIIIPDGVSKIRSSSFPNKEDIVSIMLPEGITEIEEVPGGRYAVNHRVKLCGFFVQTDKKTLTE